MVKIKQNLENICNFLKPGIPECIIAGASLPISAISCGLTYIVTRSPYYSACAAVAPQILEYTSFRLMELGVFGKNIRNFIKGSKGYGK